MTGGIRFIDPRLRRVAVVRGSDDEPRPGVPALLFGAGRAGAMMARSAMREPKAGVKPVGFLDDDLRRKGQRVAGLPVFGGLERPRRGDRRDRRQDAADHDAERVRRGRSAGSWRRRSPRASRSGPSRRSTSLFDGTHRRLSASASVRVEDLLDRASRSTDHAPAVDELDPRPGRDDHGRRRLDRLGAGAPGLRASGRAQLVLVDRAESPLYMIQRELELARACDGRGGGGAVESTSRTSPAGP